MNDGFLPPPPSNDSKKEEKIPTATLYEIISDWINHRSDMLPDCLKGCQLNKYYRAIKQDMAEDMPTILEQYQDENKRPIVRFSSIKSIAMEAGKVFRQFEGTEFYQLHMSAQQLEKALTHWAVMSTTNGGLPPAMVGYDDGRPAFYRLQYEPTESEVIPGWQCPTWAEIGSRMTNWKAFCMRVASIYDENADRKQAIYIHGPKDSGKSQIEAIISHISGGEAPSGGGFTVLTPDQTKSAHWLEPLVGKRVVCISEAATSFLESNKFKSLTGDLRHMVNPKGKPIVNRPLPVIIFMFANEPPEISSKGELMERIIDCRIDPPKLNGQGLIPDHIYQQQLKDELPEFLGYCFQLYEKHKGCRLPCEKEDLKQFSKDYEGYALDFFNAYWEIDKDNPENRLHAHVVYQRMMQDGIRHGAAQRRIYDIWDRELGLKRLRSRGATYFKGIKPKPAPFKLDDTLDNGAPK